MELKNILYTILDSFYEKHTLQGNMKNRIIELDYIKGLAIVLVVLGHVIHLVNSNCYDCGHEILSLLYKWIYIFHMPLFFIVSGFLFAPSEHKIARKIIRLLVPLIIFSLPHVISHVIYMEWSNDIFKNLIGEMKYLIVGGYYWYLTFLIYMMSITWVWTVCCSKAKMFRILQIYISEPLISLVLCLILIFLYIYLARNTEDGILVRFTYNLFFFTLGFSVRDKKENVFKILNNIRNRTRILIFINAVFLCVLFLLSDNCIIKVLAAFFMILVVITSVRYLNNNRTATLLARLGTNTLIIYLFDGYLITIESYLGICLKYVFPLIILFNLIIPVFCREKLMVKNKYLKILCG